MLRRPTSRSTATRLAARDRRVISEGDEVKLFRIFILVLIIDVLASMAGCCSFFPGADDAIFRVAGIAPSDSECALHLFADDKEIYKPVKVKGSFETTYYLSFCTQSYAIQAVCNGKSTYSQVVKFPSRHIPQPYHLGDITRQ